MLNPNDPFKDLTPEEKEEQERKLLELEKKISNNPLYKKAQEIFELTKRLADAASEKEKSTYLDPMLASATILAPKIAGAISSENWLISMQDAAIIRYHGEQLLLQHHILKEFTNLDQESIDTLRSEMERFQTLFREWVETFKELEDDRLTDDWGLFRRRRG